MVNQIKVFTIVSSIPKGKVLTYGDVARISGLKSPRLVGNILHKNPNPKKIPCHRVVNSKGMLAESFAFGGLDGQIKKLSEDGVEIKKDRVNLEKYIWIK